MTQAVDQQAGGEARGMERALFALIVAEPRAWTLGELEAELGPLPTLLVSVAALHDTGLAHWHGEHVLPTLAARRADELAG